MKYTYRTCCHPALGRIRTICDGKMLLLCASDLGRMLGFKNPEEYVKKQVISQMKQNIILIKKADKYDCKLTHSEKQQCSDSALSYYQDKTGKKVMKECGATREDVEKIYEDSTLASKVQKKIESKEKVTVTDDEARKSTIYRVVFATTKTGDNGQTTEMSKKEKKAVKAKAEKALKEIQSGKKTIKKVAKEQN